MNFIYRINGDDVQLSIQGRQILTINIKNLAFYYNSNNNLIQLEVLRYFTQSLTEGLTVNNVLIITQQNFNDAMSYLFTKTNILPTFTSNTAAITAGLTNGMQYYLPITNDNYVICSVVGAAPPLAGTAILGEDGNPILNENGQPILNEI